jgi:hypothetical protein
MKVRLAKVVASQKARKAQEESPAPAEFAGNASRLLADWNADTGATSIMTPHHWMHNYTPKRVPVKLADETIRYWVCSLNQRLEKLRLLSSLMFFMSLNLEILCWLCYICGYNVKIDTAVHVGRGKQTVFTAINNQNAAFLTLTASLEQAHQQQGETQRW